MHRNLLPTVTYMNQTLNVIVLFAFLVGASIARAAPFCSWEISVLNGETREEKHFSPGSASFDIPLEELKGFKTCKVLPERMFDFHGSPTSRLEIYCYTTSGDAVMSQAIASSKTGADVTRFQLLARPVSIHTGAEETNINSSGYREFMMYCK